LAEQYALDPDACRALAFECSQCGLCTATCPKHLDPPAMFLKWRQEAVSSGTTNLSAYKGILRYEKTGCSKRFSFYSLPRDCDTVFFPGCTLTGTRPEPTLKAYEYLNTRIPNSGIVLDCCTKPSHDIGRKDFFDAMFSEMIDFLKKNRITTVITACPSCHKVFETHSRFRVKTIYEIMAEDTKFIAKASVDDTPIVSAVVQDPCQSRYDFPTQTAVRTLAERLGIDIIESKQSREKTLCCGEGAFVGCIHPDTADSWTVKRQKAAKGRDTLTYCAGCVNQLSGPGRNLHILDLAFGREQAVKISKSPFTYANRLKLKKRLAARPGRITRERTFFHGKPPRLLPIPPPILIPGLIAVLIGGIGFLLI